MASKGKHTSNPGYQAGNHWNVCQRCGFDMRLSDSTIEWNGLKVCNDCWEPRHPLDFAQAHPEDTSAKGVVTGQPADVYVNNAISLTLDTASYTYDAGAINEGGVPSVTIELTTASYAYTPQTVTATVGNLITLDTASYAYTAQSVTVDVSVSGSSINIPGFGYMTTTGGSIDIPGFGYFTG